MWGPLPDLGSSTHSPSSVSGWGQLITEPCFPGDLSVALSSPQGKFWGQCQIVPEPLQGHVDLVLRHLGCVCLRTPVLAARTWVLCRDLHFRAGIFSVYVFLVLLTECFSIALPPGGWWLPCSIRSWRVAGGSRGRTRVPQGDYALSLVRVTAARGTGHVSASPARIPGHTCGTDAVGLGA